MLFYLNYFKFRNINVVRRFRSVVSWYPERVLFINAENEEEWTATEVGHTFSSGNNE